MTPAFIEFDSSPSTSRVARRTRTSQSDTLADSNSAPADEPLVEVPPSAAPTVPVPPPQSNAFTYSPPARTLAELHQEVLGQGGFNKQLRGVTVKAGDIAVAVDDLFSRVDKKLECPAGQAERSHLVDGTLRVMHLPVELVYVVHLGPSLQEPVLSICEEQCDGQTSPGALHLRLRDPRCQLMHAAMTCNEFGNAKQWSEFVATIIRHHLDKAVIRARRALLNAKLNTADTAALCTLVATDLKQKKTGFDAVEITPYQPQH